MFARQVHIYMGEEEPTRKATRKVDATKSFGLAIEFVAVGADLSNGLSNLEAVPFNRKLSLRQEILKGASRVLIGHPVPVEALVKVGMARRAHVPPQINR